MPVTPTYPGVYVQELPSGVHTIVGVGTSITAFVGIASRGPVNDPVTISNFGDYERNFGGLWYPSTMSYAVNHYFMNGGSQAVIVRVLPAGAAKGTIALPVTGPPTGTLSLIAINEGAWFDNVYATVDHVTTDPSATDLFNLTIREYSTQLTIDPKAAVVHEEVFRNVSVTPSSPRFITNVLVNESSLVRVNGSGTMPTHRPDDVVNHISDLAGADSTNAAALISAVTGSGFASGKLGIYALEKVDLFNLLCIPPPTRTTDHASSVWSEVIAYGKTRRAITIVDPYKAWDTVSEVTDGSTGLDSLNIRDENAAYYFPWVKAADPLVGNAIDTFAAGGAVAGVIARTDSERGIWKAPAGLDARLVGVQAPVVKFTDSENGQLNPIGVNVLRTLPGAGNVIWGARTLVGADRLASDWKYLPVRRTALYIEESLYRGTQWVVFEPNDEPLWGQIRLNVGAFMHDLFRKGAFQGAKASEAYFVKCDSETTTQNDINQGVVNVIVGFAPLKPAEFVIIKLQQMAGQIQS